MENILIYSGTMTAFIVASMFAMVIVASVGRLLFEYFFQKNAKPLRSAVQEAYAKHEQMLISQNLERFDESEADIRQGFTKSRTGAPMALP